jgi:putative spermidine/putrescine transport system permease protein
MTDTASATARGTEDVPAVTSAGGHLRRSRRPSSSALRLLLALPALVLVIGFFGLAMVMLVRMGFHERTVNAETSSAGWTLQNLGDFLFNRDRDYWGVVATTFKLAGLVVLFTALIGYPVAFGINAVKRPWIRSLLYFILFAPLFVSVVVRTYAWTLLLGNEGLINKTLMWLHLRDEPVALLYQFPGVLISMVHIMLPFMVFPIVSVLGQLSPELRQAALDLGASRLQVFFRVLLPLSLQGVVVGCQLVLAISAGAFAAPVLLGGGRVEVLSSVIFTDVGAINWSMAAIEAIIMLVLLLAGIMLLGLLNTLVYREKKA